ncbi:peptidoglycan D,D-transpeptidase FtsI family protein [Alicyclobacillus fodiniaquatilis]|uniref:Peptidoglycan D,D-transpeptidase FtsI family protein n=1 Tax=Alicyclobacillus fodiniaquatilis TaxID=1661150 RepID=A0ABW4JPH7_9BACL
MKKEKKVKPVRKIFRINVVYMMVFASFTALILRGAYIQIVQGASFRQAELNTQVEKIPEVPQRGWIYDANGQVLAMNKPSMSVMLDRYSTVSDAAYRRIAKVLAPVLKKSSNQLYKRMTSNGSEVNVLLATNLTDAQVSFIAEHHSELPNIDVEQDYQRYYPNGDLAGHVLGYTGRINQGNEAHYAKLGYKPVQTVGETGLEWQYEHDLQGKIGYQLVAVDASGDAIRNVGSMPPPTAGNNIQLTLDGHMQAEAQMIVQNLIDSSSSRDLIQEASAVMLNVKTGGVISMVSYPYIDPNWYTNGKGIGAHQAYLSEPFVQTNTAIQNYEFPGSTVKPANAITALKADVIWPGYVMQDHEFTYIGSDPTPKDDDGTNHGLVDTVKAIAVSCDTFFYEVGLHLGKWYGADGSHGGSYPASVGSYQKYQNTDFAKGINQLFQGEWNFGLGPLTGIDLPGEAKGVFYIEDDTQGNKEVTYDLKKSEQSIAKTGKYVNHGSPADLANAGIGQSQEFTTTQLGEYVMTLANNGKKLQPHLLDREYGPNDTPTSGTKPLKTVKTKVTGQVKANQQYFYLVKQGMYGVTTGSDATASGLFGSNYQVAAKTGTATIYVKPNGSSASVKTDNSVFICYAPLNNPQVALAVMAPGGGYGASFSGIIAKKLLDAYFDEHHASFMPKKDWTNTKIPSNWKASAAYTLPEQGHLN